MARTNPALWSRVKAEIKRSSKGGKPGEWSARKAQLAGQLYRKRGGRYRGGKSKAQRSLTKWTSEKWRTRTGKKARSAGATSRYLPDKAWKKLTSAQAKATDQKKRTASRKGKQYVSNTKKAKSRGRAARRKK